MVVRTPAHDFVRRARRLLTSHTNIVPLIHVCIDAERAHGPENDLRSSAAVKSRTWDVDGEVRVAKVLQSVGVSGVWGSQF